MPNGGRRLNYRISYLRNDFERRIFNCMYLGSGHGCQSECFAGARRRRRRGLLRRKPSRWGFTAAAVAVAAGTAVALAGAGAATASTPAIVWGPAQAISISPSVGTYPDASAMSCPVPGDCVAAGNYYNGAWPGFVVVQENGVWGTAQPISGLSPLTGGASVEVNSVSCASPGNCAVAGSAYGPYPASGGVRLLRGFVVSETDGVWGSADILPPPVTAAKLGAGKLQSVSCSAPGDCIAGGYDSTDYQTTEAEVIEETNGTWGAPTLIPGAPAYDQVESVSCTAPGDCVAGLGSTHTGFAAALATESGGTWSVQAVPGLAALNGSQQYSSVESVSCLSAGDCTAAGEFEVPASGVGRLFVVTEQDGTWGQASELAQGPEYAGAEIPLSCAAPGDCALAASGVIADQVDGSWSTGASSLPVQGLPGANGVVTALSCPSAGNCSAGGEATGGADAMHAFVIDETNGAWGQAVQVAGTNDAASIGALSCATAASCVASGTGGVGGLVGFFTEEVPVAPTATTVSLSSRSVPYGHEQAETVTVAVSAATGTPTGTVTVRSGSSPVCTISLASGQGSCALGAARFAAGAVPLTATYSGPAWYAASASPAVSLQVTRAATRTALRLSARTVRFRHERSERLSVMVTPQYAGLVTGTVAVTVGRTTVCVVRLSKGAGSCLLSASKLRPGTHRLVARYGSTTDFSGSVSRAALLRVRR